MISAPVEIGVQIAVGDTRMSGKNTVLTSFGSSTSKPAMLESWDSQYNTIPGSSLQNQIVGSLHLGSGLTSCSLGASSNAKHHELMSATSKLNYAKVVPDAVQQPPAASPLFRDSLTPRRWRREGERSQSHESSDTDMEFRQSPAAEAAPFLLDGQWESEPNQVSVAGIWEPAKRAKTQQQYEVTNLLQGPLVVTGYMNLDSNVRDGRVSHIEGDDVAISEGLHSYHGHVLAGSERWLSRGFGGEPNDLHMGDNQQNSRKRQLELDSSCEESILSGHFESGFEAPRCQDQHLTAREAYEEFQLDHHDETSSNKRLVKRSSKGGPRRPNIIKGQWTIEEDRCAQRLSRANIIADYRSLHVLAD